MAQSLVASEIEAAEAKKSPVVDYYLTTKTDKRKNLAKQGFPIYVPVAQLDSALDSDSKGRRFESCRAYQKRHLLLQVSFTFIQTKKIFHDS